MKFSMGEKDYSKIAANIVGYSNDQRVVRQKAKNPNDMDVDHIIPDVYSQHDWQAYTEELEQWYVEELNYMGKTGKGGIKGKGGKGGKGNFKGKGKGKGKGKTDYQPNEPRETRVCHWCKKAGHLKRDCRRFLAGKPKVPEAQGGASSLEHPDWEADDDSDVEGLEDCFPFDDLDSDDADGEDFEDFEGTDDELHLEHADAETAVVGPGKEY